jgi:hypothetical protein
MSRSVLLLAFLLTPVSAARSQLSPVPHDSVEAAIRTRLRAFYFNLAHRDWDALTADILAAKVVAHRPPPDALLRGERPVRASEGCDSTAIRIDQAAITLDGAWANVSVPHCTVGFVGADLFRLIYFEDRWRFVHIDLSDEPVNLTVER